MITINNIGTTNLFALILISFYIIFLTKKNSFIKKTYIFNILLISAILNFIILIYCFINNMNNIEIVNQSSHTILPLIYKIGSIWSSQIGSLTLWLFISAFIGLIIFNYFHNPSKYLIYSYSIIYLILGSILLLNNPFLEINYEQDGKGLNPLLQDIALLIHPPILYTGYVFAFIIFALSFDISNNKRNQILLLSSKYCLLFISVGIFLGSWWAYKELGWGGYWYFDPVENISLLPFILSLIYHHNIMTKSFNKFQGLIGISIFLSIITGTCLTRSGFLMSVHSFINSSNQGYYYLITALLINIASYTYYLSLQYKNNNFTRIKLTPITLFNFTSLILLTIILLSLIIPILLYLLINNIINFEYDFFVKLIIPLTLFIIFIMGLSSNNKILLCKRLVIKLLLSLIITSYLYYYYFYNNLLGSIAIFVSILLMLESFICIIISYRNNKLYQKSGMIISHFGVALLCLSITLNKHYEQEYNILGKVNDIIKIDHFDFHIKDIRYARSKNYLRQIIDVEIYNHLNKETYILSPEQRLYIVEKLINSEANIISNIFNDLYGVINNIQDDKINLTIYNKPVMSLIWIACFLIAFGIII